MLIDWFTVLAQVLNFLILVWLMKRFLYRPILDALDAREKRIAAELADADARKAEAREERDAFRQKNEEFEKQRATLLSRATDEASVRRQQLLDEARQAAEALSSKRHESLRNEARNLNQALRQRTQEEVFAIARKALADLAGSSLEEAMADAFARRLRELNGDEKHALVQTLKTSSDPALVRSAFELPPQQRAAIQRALRETIDGSLEVSFQTAPGIISGIELTANGHKVSWSIADYLASMEQGLAEILKKSNELPA